MMGFASSCIGIIISVVTVVLGGWWQMMGFASSCIGIIIGVVTIVLGGWWQMMGFASSCIGHHTHSPKSPQIPLPGVCSISCQNGRIHDLQD